MNPEDFKKECDEWMNSLGYSHLRKTTIGQKVIYTYHSDIGNPYYPVIDCWDDGDRKHCQIYDASYPMFLTLTTGPMQYKHPDMVKFIATFITITSNVKNIECL